MKKSAGDRIFDIINVLIMLCLVLITLYPMYYVLCASVSSNTYLVAHLAFYFGRMTSRWALIK